MTDKSGDKAGMTFEELTPGYEFPAVNYELSASLISRYLKAVDSVGGEFVPPLAIAAYAMTAMTNFLSVPSGAIHASQELEFFKLVPVGSQVKCQAKVARKIARSQIRMLVLELNVWDQHNEKVQLGRAMVVLPTQV
ncbi:MAG: MaoC family dehydratase [Chloroflexota bacterium]|nr:MaoC family dehydratase [Chloroflexota bacterium]